MYVVIVYLPIYAIVKARSLMTLAFTGNGDMQVYGLTIKSKTMGKEKVTANDLKVTLSEHGVTSGLKQEKIIQRLQVNGCLIAMVTDILDQLIKDEQSMFRLLKVQYKQEQKMHYNQMRDAAEKYYFHLKPFNKSFLHPYMVIGGKRYRFCEPYEGNEHFLND